MKALYRLFYYLSILLTSLFAGFTLAGAFAGNASPDNSMLMPFIGLFLPALLLANLALAIYWCVRWRCWVLIPLIAILGNWAYLSRVLQFPLFNSAAKPKMIAESTSHTNPPHTTLTVATYNVDAFHHEHTGYSCKQIAEQMKNLNVDILCFQEFGVNSEFGIDSLCAALSEWSYHYIPCLKKVEHLQLAVFSRYPIRETKHIIFPDSKNNSLWCDIVVNDKMIRLFNNHLQTTEVSRNKRKLEKELRTDDTEKVERAAFTLLDGLHDNFKKRTAQATLLNQLIAESPHPTLVCGDFNSLPSSYVYKEMKGNRLKDGFQTCGHGYMYTFRYIKHLLRIDYIFHSPEFTGLDYFSPNLVYSDHNPVVMRMKME